MRKLSHILPKKLNPFSRNNPIFKKSFSQCGEDIIIEHIFGKRISKPTYIDVGAHHPWYFNNTAKFYLKGSVGINIEPDPFLFKSILKVRKKDINLNIGLANKKGILDFYIMEARTLNTFSKKEALDYENTHGYKIQEIKKIEVNTLKYIIDNYFDGNPPDYISIDVEGMDFEIVKEIDYNNPPIVICVETITFSETGNGKKNYELIEFIKNKGYINYADTYINTIFVLKDFWVR